MLPWRWGRSDGPTSESQPPEEIPSVPEHTLGLNVLVDPGDEAVVDIVAVHGLGGDAYATWTHPNGTLWLRDLLPKSQTLDKARIMTFGYDISIFTQASKERSFTFSETLLSKLRDKRPGKLRNRPLCFIAHSLGGIVVKKALLIAYSRQSLYKELLSSIHHLMFMGTPHRGSDCVPGFLRSLGMAITRAKDGSVLRELDLWSSSLIETNALFIEIVEKFSVTTFFEREKTYGKQVVDEGSARLDIKNEQVIGLGGNHLQICKFPSMIDPSYRDVVGRLEAEFERIQEMKAEREREQRVQLMLAHEIALDKLQPVAKMAAFDSFGNSYDPYCLPGTREDVLKEIRAWIRGNQASCIFWLSGMPGTGKSTIARTVASEFHDQKQLGASFFFVQGHGDLDHARSFFTTITMQLARTGDIDLQSSICKAIRDQPDFADKGLAQQWQKLIFQPLSELQRGPNSSPLVIVIDALDECDNERDVKSIIDNFATAKDLSGVRLRIVVTSRPEWSIQGAFQRTEICHRGLILQDVPRQIVDSDICLFFYQQFNEIKAISPLFGSQMLPEHLQRPTIDEINYLVQSAAGLFIYAATVCRFIGTRRKGKGIPPPGKRLDLFLPSTRDDDPIGRFTSTGISPPQTDVIDQMYAEILESGFRRIQEESHKEEVAKFFREIAGAIIVLLEPLSVRSIARLLEMEETTVTWYLKDFHALFDVRRDPSAPVRSFHLSFPEYITSSERCRDRDFYVDATERHGVLARKCIQLLQASLKEDICDLSHPGMLARNIDQDTISSHITVEISYACRYWKSHAQTGGIGLGDNEVVHKFLTKHFLHWLEVMSILGRFSEATSAIVELAELIRPQISPALHAFLHDARRFLLAHSTTLEVAPLQVYSSALLFSPKSSIVRNTFQEGVQGVSRFLEMQSQTDEQWSICLQTLEGHNGSVKKVIFSPDGSLLASASSAGAVRLWNTETGHCQYDFYDFEDHSRSLNDTMFPERLDLGFSEKGDLLTLASASRGLLVWNVSTGARTRIRAFSNTNTSMRSVLLSPDVSTVATNTHQSELQIWDVQTGELRHVSQGDATRFENPVAFSRDSSQVSSLSNDLKVRVWNPRTGQLLQTLEFGSNSVSSMAFSPDGTILAVASASGNGSVLLWDLGTGSCRFTLEYNDSGHVREVLFSPDGLTIASRHEGETITLWCSKTGRSQQEIPLRHDYLVEYVYLTLFAPDGSTIWWGSRRKGALRSWHIKEKQYGRSFPSNGIVSYSFSPVEPKLVTGSEEGSLRIWDLSAGEALDPRGRTSREVQCVTFSPDGLTVASGFDDCEVRLWNSMTGKLLHIFSGSTLPEDSLRMLSFAPDGVQLASVFHYGKIRVLHVERRRQLHQFEIIARPYPHMTSDMKWSPDGSHLAVATEAGAVRLYHSATGDSKPIGNRDEESGTCIAFSPCGTLLAYASPRSPVQLWSLATNQPHRILAQSGYTLLPQTMVFVPGGSLLAYQRLFPPTITVLDVKTGQHHFIPESKSLVTGPLRMAFSLDGSLMAVRHKMTEIAIWDLRSSRKLAHCAGFIGIDTFLFSRDNTVLEVNGQKITIPPLNVEKPSQQPIDQHGRSALWQSGFEGREAKEIIHKSRAILRLPEEYRPRTWARHGNTLVFAGSSGRLTFFWFKE